MTAFISPRVPLPVILENRRHPLHVSRTWVAGNQVLDQLLGNKGRRIGMVEQRVQGNLQIAGWIGSTCRDGHT